MEEIKKNIHVVSYPRSGSSYMVGLLGEVFDIWYNHQIFKSHLDTDKDLYTYSKAKSTNFKQDNFVVTILRDPIDTFTSALCQELFFDKNNIDELLSIRTSDNKHGSMIEYYKSFWENVPTFADLILNYNDINNHRDNIVKYISNNTGYGIRKKRDGSLFYDDDFIKDRIHLRFVRSTKDHSEYNLIKEKLKSVDLDDCYKIYNDLLTRCKKFE